MPRRPGEDLQNPDFSGPRGRAWQFKVEYDPEVHAELGSWLIEDVATHALWNYRAAVITHLRPVPGLPDANIRRPGASHMFTLASLHPDYENEYDPNSPESIRGRVMKPLDVVHQLVMPSDERALSVCRLAIQLCLDGELPADEDYRSRWISFFNSQESK